MADQWRVRVTYPNLPDRSPEVCDTTPSEGRARAAFERVNEWAALQPELGAVVTLQRRPVPEWEDVSEHPEHTCRRCGGPNRSWHAPSPLWNAVMRGGSINGPWEFGELICPTCFVVLAEERGIASDWRVDALCVAVELETVTPSGRVWDAQRMLWTTPVTAGRCEGMGV